MANTINYNRREYYIKNDNCHNKQFIQTILYNSLTYLQEHKVKFAFSEYYNCLSLCLELY